MWTVEDMDCALMEVQRGVPVLRVSQDYNIPRSTLRKHIKHDDATTANGVKVMENLNLDRNTRERRKPNNNVYKPQNKSAHSKKALYNEHGVNIETGLDLCDCFNKRCPGCYFPCPNCGSCKCGHECRANRRWKYESHEIHGTQVLVTNAN